MGVVGCGRSRKVQFVEMPRRRRCDAQNLLHVESATLIYLGGAMFGCSVEKRDAQNLRHE